MKTQLYCLPVELVHLAVPRLEWKGIKAGGVLPRIPTVKAGRKEPKTEVEASVEATVPVPVEASTSQKPARRKPVTPSVKEDAPKVVVKVVPTPKKRKRKVTEAKIKQASPPKPLKVIRRRRGEEEQKVFETDPRSIPKAMLAGIIVPSKDDMDSHAK